VFFKLDHSVTEDHLRHVLFWQAENLTLAWANYEMFNNIRAVYESLYEHLSRQVNPSLFLSLCVDLQLQFKLPLLQCYYAHVARHI